MPKGPQGQKRPGDVIGAAVRVAQIATGEADDEIEDDGKDPENFQMRLISAWIAACAAAHAASLVMASR